ncbi:MAG: GtrA family protein [Acidimicrobiales bacterium]
MSPRASSPRRARIVHLAKYASVSAISTVSSLAILGVLVAVFGLSGVWSNVIATAVGTVPSFELNRRWVWSKRSGPRRPGQIAAFCLLSLAGLVCSTIAVHLASDVSSLSGRLVHTVAIEAANVAAYGLLWVIQFFLCDRVLFGPIAMPLAIEAPASAPASARGGSSRDHRAASRSDPMHHRAGLAHVKAGASAG